MDKKATDKLKEGLSMASSLDIMFPLNIYHTDFIFIKSCVQDTAGPVSGLIIGELNHFTLLVFPWVAVQTDDSKEIFRFIKVCSN